MSSEEKDIKKSQAPTLIQCIEKEGKTVSDIANALGVASTQVYKWNREGIKASSKHYEALKSIIPSLQPAEERITAKGKPDGRSNSGVKKKNLVLSETDLPSIKEKSFKSTLFPKIIFKKETVVGFVLFDKFILKHNKKGVIYMARATILGDVIQIKSRLTKEQLKRAENFRPGTSVLEDGNGNEVFRIEYGKSASFSKYGISFCSTDENGFMFLTVANNIEHNDNIETERRKIRDDIGVILHKCNMVEDAVIDALGEINEINDAIDSSVVIIDDSETPLGIMEETATSVTFE